MTAPWEHRSASDVDPTPESAPAPTTAPTTADATVAPDELAVLDQLEADLSAVERAVESLERVASEGFGGDDAAAQIAAAVSVERFGAPAASA
jgi:hypothetical protein